MRRILDLQLGAVVAFFALLVLAGAGMRISSLSPDALVSPEFYSSLNGLHGISGLFVPAAFAVACAAWVNRVDLITGLVVLALCGGLVARLAEAPPFAVIVAFTLASVAAGVSLARSALSSAAFTFTSWGLVGASFCLFLAGATLLFGWPGALLRSIQTLTACALVLASEAAGLRPHSRAALGVYGLGSAFSIVAPGSEPFIAGVVLPAASMILAFTAWRTAAAKPRWTRDMLRIAALLFAQAALLRGFLSTVGDVHLRDTLFVVGVYHAEMFALTGAVFSLPRCVPRGARRQWAPFLFGVSAHMMCWTFVKVGTMGMPAHYLNYLPELQSLQVVITVAGLATVAALTWIGIALVSAAREQAEA
jgi:hypothetical protein